MSETSDAACDDIGGEERERGDARPHGRIEVRLGPPPVGCEKPIGAIAGNRHGLDAARAKATVGEISLALEKVYGRHRAEIKAISGVYKREVGSMSPAVERVLKLVAAPDGKWRTRKVWHMLVQVPNHQTEHRSQVAGMLGAMGLEVPQTDMVVYLSQLGSKG